MSQVSSTMARILVGVDGSEGSPRPSAGPRGSR